MALSVEGWRLRLAAVAVGLVALHLGGEWSQGGIASHHFLADPSMPAISNAWGLLWLPLLAVLYAPSIRRRAIGTGLGPRWRPGMVAGLLGGLAAGGAIAAFVVVRPDIDGTWVLGSLLALVLIQRQRSKVRRLRGQNAELDRMVRDREAHALDDLAYRRLVDVRNKAEPVLRATEKQMDDARRLLAADSACAQAATASSSSRSLHRRAR